MGMTKKSFTNLQKLSMIISAIREAFAQMKAGPVDKSDAPCTVKKTDVESAFDIINQSILTFKCFKVSQWRFFVLQLLLCYSVEFGKRTGRIHC